MKLLKILYRITLLIFITFMFIITKYLARLLGFLRIGTTIYRDKSILTPVVQLVHPKTQKRIVLMGVIHIGESEYFIQLQHVINTLKGYKVLYEGIGSLTKEQESGLTKEERVIYDAIQDSMHGRTFFTALLRLQQQKEGGLLYEDSWIRTDMTLFTLVRKMAERNIPWTKSPEMPKKNDKIDKLVMAWILNAMLVRIGAFFILPIFLQLMGKKPSELKSIIIGERNEIAVAGILEHINDANVVSIWGAGHLPGMIKLLKKHGYREQERTWFVAYKERQGYLKEAFKEIVKESKKRSSKA